MLTKATHFYFQKKRFLYFIIYVPLILLGFASYLPLILLGFATFLPHIFHFQPLTDNWTFYTVDCPWSVQSKHVLLYVPFRTCM